MPITHHSGGTSFDGKQAIDLYRMATLLSGIRMEYRTNGKLRLTGKGPSCYTIIKREYGFKGNRRVVLDQFEDYFQVMKSKVEIIDETSAPAVR